MLKKVGAIVSMCLLALWRLGADEVRLSIFPFQSDAQRAEVAQAATALVETAFIKEGRFDVITRRDMEALLSQQELSISDVTDPSSAIRVGKVLTAQFVVIGEVQGLGEVVLLAARMLDVETGRVVAAETGTARTVGELAEACGVLTRSLTAQFFGEALAEEEGKALLFVRSIPEGARVYLNGKYAGETPFRLEHVAQRTYRVRVELDGYVPYETNVRIREPRIYRVEASLVRDEAFLRIDAQVAAEVLVDGEFVGYTPVEIALRSGKHTLKLEAEGYHPETKRIVLQPGQELDLSCSLKRKRPLFEGLEREQALGLFFGWGTSTITLGSSYLGEEDVVFLSREEARTGWWSALSFYLPFAFFSIDAELAAERTTGYGSRVDLVLGVGSPTNGVGFSPSIAWLITFMFPRGFEEMEEQVPVVWPWGFEASLFVPLTRNFLFRFSADTYDLESWGIKLMAGVAL